MTEILQDLTELGRFVDIVRESGARSFLEIGSKFGNTLRAVAEAMPVGSRIVSVDLPHGTRLWRESSVSLQQTVLDLQAKGYDSHLVWGDSTDHAVIMKVAKLAPFDAVLIDANHTSEYVKRDWANYGSLARKLCAFHDIAWHRAPEWKGVRIDVPQFWDSIKDLYPHEEIKHCPTGKNNGIGVVWLST